MPHSLSFRNREMIIVWYLCKWISLPINFSLLRNGRWLICAKMGHWWTNFSISLQRNILYTICAVRSVILQPRIALLGWLPRFKLAQNLSRDPWNDKLFCEEKKVLGNAEKENATCRGSNGLRTRYLIRTGWPEPSCAKRYNRRIHARSQ